MPRRGYDLPDALPLFPLGGAVLLPRTRLPLNIFEPRYLQMVEDVLKTPERLIAVIQQLDDDGALATVGAAGRIVGFSEDEDGRYMIALGHVARFRLLSVDEGFSPYLTGRVKWSGQDEAPAAAADKDWDRTRFLSLLRRYMDGHELSTDWDAARDADAELLVNSLAMALPFEAQEKQALLEARDACARRELLEGLLEYELRGGDSDEVLQ
ncbi:MAG: LON peptidase substrate-binding domain-containing protein [Paracoccus sp. (in: a-proteobacteria)]|nr:LON peptidase substrate-binding domain-containing protein [Paracoccus sp. (in: a-proteobacteria)]